MTLAALQAIDRARRSTVSIVSDAGATYCLDKTVGGKEAHVYAWLGQSSPRATSKRRGTCA